MLTGYLERRRTIKAMRQIPLFAGCSSRELRRVNDLSKVVWISAGAQLTVEGKGARDCCVLLEGKAEVRAGGEVVAVLRPGALVGEVSLLTNQPRSSTVVTQTSVRAMVFDAPAFATMLSGVPSVRNQVLASRPANGGT